MISNNPVALPLHCPQWIEAGRFLCLGNSSYQGCMELLGVFNLPAPVTRGPNVGCFLDP